MPKRAARDIALSTAVLGYVVCSLVQLQSPVVGIILIVLTTAHLTAPFWEGRRRR